MLGLFKGLVTTVKTFLRRPVTAQYPNPKKRLPLATRYMGFPGLLWDSKVDEPYCTGCQVCARYCPTQCITVTMKDNPRFKEGTSPRKKIVEDFSINIAKCILCSICVEVCAFDAIEMTPVHEQSITNRRNLVIPLETLFEWGKLYQEMRPGMLHLVATPESQKEGEKT